MLRQVAKVIKKNQFLVLIIVIAALVRFIAIGDNPPSLNWDEVSHGYNAYSILKTGKDEWGKSFPTIFRAYGDYKLPVYIYLTALSELFFGLSAFAVRLPSVLAGIVTVIFTYLLVKELSRKRGNTQNLTQKDAEAAATLAALLVTVEPWSLFLSRGAFEANLALAFITGGVYFFMRGLRATNYMLPATVLLGLSVWTYNSARIFTPILLLLLIYLFKRDIKKIYKKSPITIHCSLITALALLVPMFYQLLNPQGLARYGKVAILDEGAIAQINEAKVTSNLSPFFARLIHNKATYFTSRFLVNWASHFSGDFLFFKGGSNYQFSIPGIGLLYSINAVFLIIGVIYLLKKRTKEGMLILGWFFIGPVASSLTREAPHVLRSITMLPAPMIITAVGFISVLNWINTRKRTLEIGNWKLEIPLRSLLLVTYVLILITAFSNYLRIYFNEYRSGYSWSWQYGYEEVVNYAKDNYETYNKIIVTKKYGEPHEFFLFFWPWDPQKFRDDPNLIRFFQSNWYWVDRFDKFYFVNDWEILRTQNEDFVLESGGNVKCQMSNVKCLLVTSPSNVPEGWNKLETINFLDKSPAFEIYEN